MMPTTATVVGVAAATARPAATLVVTAAICISGLLAILIVILCYVSVFSSRSRSTRAIKVLGLLIGGAGPEPPKGGEARSNS